MAQWESMSGTIYFTRQEPHTKKWYVFRAGNILSKTKHGEWDTESEANEFLYEFAKRNGMIENFDSIDYCNPSKAQKKKRRKRKAIQKIHQIPDEKIAGEYFSEIKPLLPATYLKIQTEKEWDLVKTVSAVNYCIVAGLVERASGSGMRAVWREKKD